MGRRLIDAYSGAFIYKRITKNKKNTFFLFLTDDDAELNNCAVTYAERCAEIKGFKNVEFICRELISQNIIKLCKKYAVNILNEKQSDKLLSYILMKSDAMGFPLLSDIRLISLQNGHNDADLLFDMGLFDKDYIMWTKMMFSGDYEDFIKLKSAL